MDNYICLNNKTLVYSTDLSTSSTPGNERDISINRTEDKELNQLSYDINFINVYVNMDGGNPTIIYIDPYSHSALIKLMELYDFANFEIYDQVPAERNLSQYVAKNSHRVSFYHEPKVLDNPTELDKDYEQFNPERLAEKYKDVANKYLISTLTDVEIRVNMTDPDHKVRQQFHLNKEKVIAKNSEKNIKISTAISAKKSFLKFRPFHLHSDLPGRNMNFPFFDGTVILPVFSGKKSSDCRMVVMDYREIIDWDSAKFTIIINNWNKKTRELLALNPFNGRKEPLPNQLGNYFEISVLFMILKDYYLSIGHLDPTSQDVYNLYSKFIVNDDDEYNEHCGR